MSGHRTIPIILFNGVPDGVGSWGDFPALLSRATGHMIVAFDRPASERSGFLGELPSSESCEREATIFARQAGDRADFESFIACGHDLGGTIAVETAARAGNACLGLITIRSPGWARPPSSDVSIDDKLSKLRCPVLALHGELNEAGPGGQIAVAIRDFLALRVFSLPIH